MQLLRPFLKKKYIAIVLILVVAFFVWQNFFAKKSQPQYETATVEKGTLVVSLAESGQVSVSNRVGITTSASGVVNNVYIKNGDVVTAGEKIADITLDQAGQQRQAQAFASYMLAKSTFDSANATLYSLQSTMFAKWKTYTDIAENSTYQNSDGSPNTSNRTLTPFSTVQDDWFAAESNYKNQQGVIAQAQASLNNTWLAYQAASSTITAPTAGTVSDIVIAPGMQIGSSGSTSTTTTAGTSTTQVIASIKNEGKPSISVNLSEADATKVRSDQKASVTFDALPNKTFTGKVLGINTTGVVSSGVTSYPAIIQLDLPNESILPNMSANANIIISIDNNVLLVPSAAVSGTSGQSTARVLKDGVLTVVPIEIGNSSDTQTEILSGLSEGDNVVTGVATTQQSGASSASPFSTNLRLGGGGGFGGRAGGGGAGR